MSDEIRQEDVSVDVIIFAEAVHAVAGGLNNIAQAILELAKVQKEASLQGYGDEVEEDPSLSSTYMDGSPKR